MAIPINIANRSEQNFYIALLRASVFVRLFPVALIRILPLGETFSLQDYVTIDHGL